ncbi:hypothetical protein GF361_03155 [Candidatus Woesearchaeota archaeon]|nr:hypothetical protein [Candidatus Woesearchaeota archaeon]
MKYEESTIEKYLTDALGKKEVQLNKPESDWPSDIYNGIERESEGTDIGYLRIFSEDSKDINDYRCESISFEPKLGTLFFKEGKLNDWMWLDECCENSNTYNLDSLVTDCFNEKDPKEIIEFFVEHYF